MSNYRYGAWHDGPDPLAPPFDAGSAVDGLAERILDGQSVRDSMRTGMTFAHLPQMRRDLARILKHLGFTSEASEESSLK